MTTRERPRRRRKTTLARHNLKLTAVPPGIQAVSLPFALIVDEAGIGVAHRYATVARTVIRGMRRKAREAN